MPSTRSNITIDTASLISFFADKGTKAALLKCVTDNQERFWNTLFNLDKRVFRQKGYDFNYTLQTDGRWWVLDKGDRRSSAQRILPVPHFKLWCVTAPPLTPEEEARRRLLNTLKKQRQRARQRAAREAAIVSEQTPPPLPPPPLPPPPPPPPLPPPPLPPPPPPPPPTTRGRHAHQQTRTRESPLNVADQE
ncbi:hypothetical protein RI054_14g67990 [Pseudoscourfieldia marina]